MPEVIEGYRSPRGERNAEAQRQAAQRDSGSKTVPAGKTVFQAVAARYRIQLTAPEETKRSDGTIKRDKALVAQFDEGLLILDDVKDKERIERIKAHASYGVDFWDFAEVLQKAKEKKAQVAIESLKDVAATPEGRAALVEALKSSGADDFEIPEDGQTVKQ